MMLLLFAHRWFKNVGNMLVKSDRGAAAVEYGLLVGLIAVVIIGAVYWLGMATHGVFCTIVSSLPFTGNHDCNAPIPTP